MEKPEETIESALLEDFAVFRVCDLQLHNRQMIGCAPTVQSVLYHGNVDQNSPFKTNSTI